VRMLLSHSVGPADGPLASRLRALTSAYEIGLVLPERGPGARPSGLREVDAVIALVTADGEDQAAVEAELARAAAARKPAVALVERSAPALTIPAGVQAVRFDRDAPHHHEDALRAALQALVDARRSAAAKKAARVTTLAIGAVVGIALGLLALALIQPKPEPEEALE
jgi:hypothetical protein